jgi:hypothetical protein
VGSGLGSGRGSGVGSGLGSGRGSGWVIGSGWVAGSGVVLSSFGWMSVWVEASGSWGGSVCVGASSVCCGSEDASTRLVSSV